MRVYAKKWRARNIERSRKYQREWQSRWRARNRSLYLSQRKAWRQRNRGKIRAQNRLWHAKHGKAWREKNKVKRREQAKRSYKRERLMKLEQQRERRRRHYWKNRDAIRAATKAQRKADPTRFRSVDRKRYLRNPEKRRHQSRVARAKRSGLDCYLSLEDWKVLLRRFRFRCAYCSVRLTNRTRSIDHVIALTRGGTNEITNLVPSCRRCNQRKGVLRVEEFFAVLKKNQ